MQIKRLWTLGTLIVLLGTLPAWAQNIQTNTTSTTLGSTQFGFAITPEQLQTVMQSANPLSCGARTAGVMDCTLDNFAKATGMPGSFTGNPNKIVWSEADFGCGTPCATEGGADPQTAPDFAGPNTLSGTINSNIDLGLGTATGDPFHAAGHITFILNPANQSASIDQLVIQERAAASRGSGINLLFLCGSRSKSHPPAVPFRPASLPDVILPIDSRITHARSFSTNQCERIASLT